MSDGAQLAVVAWVLFTALAYVVRRGARRRSACAGCVKAAPPPRRRGLPLVS